MPDRDGKKKKDPAAEIELWLERELVRAADGGELPAAHEQEEALAAATGALVSGRNLVVTGEPGVGKSCLIGELVRRVRGGQAAAGLTRLLAGRPVLQLSIRRRATALKPPAQLGQPLIQLTRALAEHGDRPVPYFRDFHLAWNFDLEPLFTALAFRLEGPILCEGRHSTVEAMFEYFPELEQHFVVLHLREPDLARARRILAAWGGARRLPGGEPQFTPEALETGLQLAHRFLSRGQLPRKAIDPLEQLADLAGGEPVGEEQVLERFCEGYALPRFLVDPGQALDLDALEEHFASRVLGQREAVAAVVEMISRIKAGLADPRRPFGVFLFAGPTGVGKTHLAQLLCEYLYGTADRMIRFNMADFPADKDAAVLFGDPDDNRPNAQRGLLTQRLQGHPFAVLLLDELEKAARPVHDRFLQLFDEGAFINGAGETVSCRSLIVIATSNAGAELWRSDVLGFSGTREAADLGRELDRRLAEHFRFETLNRFDAIVKFRPLAREHIRSIALRELEALQGRAGLRQRELELEVDEGVLDWLTANGYDPHYGARFLRRTIERTVSATLAELLVRETPPRGARLGLAVRRNRIRARLLEPRAPEPPAREAVELPEGPARRRVSLDRASLLAQADELLAAAGERRTELETRSEEHRELLALFNEPAFWEEGSGNPQLLDRFRELDVALRVEGRLAERIDRLAELRRAADEPAAGEEPEARWMARFARALQSAADALHEWRERSAEEGGSRSGCASPGSTPCGPPAAG